MFELSLPEETLLREIADKSIPQASLARTYALAIRTEHQPDWARVNRAIMERWSRSGLERVKRLAWRILDEVPEVTK